MRIISGKIKGQTFNSPGGHRTHPMSDKIRGALFNALGDISGLEFLDCYGGTGALSYEAISRGAKCSVVVELDKNAQKAIAANIDKLGLSKQITLMPMSCLGWSMRNHSKTFDVVTCDPPYDSVLMRDIQKLSIHVKHGGVLALSWPTHVKAEEIDGLEKLKTTTYGDATLVFYRRIS